MATDRVRFVGDSFAVVFAETAAQAEDAANAFVKAEEKVKILLKEGLLKAPLVKKAKPAEAAAAEPEKA